MKSRGPLLLLTAAMIAGLGACGAGSGSAQAPEAGPTAGSRVLVAPTAGSRASVAPAGGSRVFVLVMENREYDQVIGSAAAPYLNHLASRRALATRYFAITHPSLPNYLAILGGSTFGISNDCTDCEARGASLATQLSGAGIGWRAYMEGMPSPCFGDPYSGGYAKKHNPFAYFPEITSDPGLCKRIVPGRRLAADLGRETIAPFSWITPDLCNDAHDCSISVGDAYLRRLVPRLLRHLGPHGLLAITFDEGTSSAGCCGNAYGGKVATILAGPDVRRNARLGKAYTHYSLLRTIEDHFGLGHLRAAASARPMRAAFR